MRRLFYLICIIVLAGCTQKINQFIEVNKNWVFAKKNNAVLLPAKVPGYVHTDLIENKLMDSLYWGENPKKYNFVANTDWIYETKLEIDSKQFSYKNKAIVFKGIDTYSDVYLNDSLILTTNNMFREYEIDVTRFLRKGKNSLKIHIKSPIDEAKKAIASYKFYNEGHRKADQENYRKFVRKAQYQFGWDWACPMIPSGIYRPVYLKLWDNYQITDLYIDQKVVGKKSAEIEANIDVLASENTTVDAEIYVNGTKKINLPVTLKTGKNHLTIPIQISNPNLWWPNGLGTQYLYKITATIKEGKKATNSVSRNVGLRTIEFVNAFDKSGKSYYFKVNGVPVFMKGANYVPIDAMLTEVSDDRYEKMIQNCVDANMNMLRIWGGGIYENDIFYDLSDKAGILIYHDFMFASRMPPSDSAFLKNVEEEATYQVKRLRNHPCMALWSGSNEIESAWFEGFMPKEYPKQVYYVDHKKIFDSILPEIVKKYDPAISYVRSSPTTGTDSILVNTPGYGDTHAWAVWFGKIDFEAAKSDRLSRFISEYGFVGYPAYTSMQKYIPASEMDTSSSVFQFRDAYVGIQNIIRDFIKRYYPQPRNIMEFSYISGLIQAEAMKVSNELYRRSMPFCMGALLWQLNDVWPVASWSLVDYYGQWKPVMYSVRESFAPTILSIEQVNDSICVHLVNDLLSDNKADLNIKVLDFEGNESYTLNKPIEIKANSAKIVYKEAIATLITGLPETKIVLEASLTKEGKTLARNLHYFKRCKDLQLSNGKIDYEIINENGQASLSIKTNKLAKNIYLIDSKGEINFSDNYFDLLAGEKRIITIDKNLKENELKKRISIFSLNELINDGKQNRLLN